MAFDGALRVGIYPAVVSSAAAMTGDTAFARLAQQVAPLLASALQEENLHVLPPENFSAFLQSRPAFDPFHADSVRKLCTAFAAHKLILPILSVSAQDSSLLHVRLILRWLDGASGEATKSHVSAHEVRRVENAALTFVRAVDAKALMQALLSGPELIISQEEAVAPLPVPVLPEPAITIQKSRKWWWYLSAAAVLGGGSAYWLLGRGEAENEPQLLPEPPGPPR